MRNKVPHCTGEIQIGDFKETFLMPLEYWYKNDYKKQWREAIERLKTHKRSCLVSEIQDPTKGAWIMMWTLYKDGEIVHIRNKFFFGKKLLRLLKKRPFTLKSCYGFVGPRRAKNTTEGRKVCEWDIDLESILRFNRKSDKQ